MTSFTAAPAINPDLDICASEPIHISGAIQPHGCMLVCDLNDWTISHASANAAAFLELTVGTELLGHHLDEILEAKIVHDLRNTLQGSMISGSAERMLDVALATGGPRYDFAMHAALGGGAIIEVTRSAGTDTATTEPAVLIKSMIGRLKRAPTLARFLQLAASQVRSVTGYDRVMVYRFFGDYSGQVVAEALRPGLQPFMGLHYPASDIPAQARELYKKQWLRMIVDVSYQPVPLVNRPGGSGQPVDLSLATLRSVSPIHLEYLRNMGSAATLTISLMTGDQLWGLIACHHEAPRRLAASTCAAAELFGQIFSLQIEAKQTTEDSARVDQARQAHDELLATMPVEATLFDDLDRFAPHLQRLLACDGLGTWVNGRFTGTGVVPPASALPALIAMLDAQEPQDIVVTSALSSLLPLATTFADRVSGLIAIRFARATHDYLLFFRSEAVRTVVWGGNPNKAVELGANGARIGPRKSFDAWREQLRGESIPWHAADVQIARTLRVSLLGVILHRADLLNKERKAAEESQSLLIAELNHRVKNILALIRSLVRQSRQNAPTIDAFTSDIEHRIRALAFAHDQLTNVGWRGAPLRRLLEAEVEAWAGAAGRRVSMRGEPVTLGSRAYQTLALVFHELMTNAAKYGALSTSDGYLAIEWSLSADGALSITWTENGGPEVTPPQRRGFGSIIIDQTIPFELQGEAHVDYGPGGVTARFVVPGGHLVASNDAVADDSPPALAVPLAISSLKGKRLLLVEDSMMIALDAQAMMAECGLDVEIAGNVADGHRALNVNTFDAAVLDVNLAGETSFPVADKLVEIKVPFVFATGYGESIVIPDRFAATAIVAKPYDEGSLSRALAATIAARLRL